MLAAIEVLQPTTTTLLTIDTNSEEVKNRIKKHYRREALVIYPPVETAKFRDLEIKKIWLMQLIQSNNYLPYLF